MVLEEQLRQPKELRTIKTDTIVNCKSTYHKQLHSYGQRSGRETNIEELRLVIVWVISEHHTLYRPNIGAY